MKCSAFVNLLQGVGRFSREERGTVAIIFALVTTPLVVFVGAAVDYGQALSTRTKLQAVVDASAAAGARLPATANSNRISAAQKAFTANAAGTVFSNVTPVIEATNAQVSVKAEAVSATNFMGLIGVDEIPVHATSAARSQIENGGVACLLALSPTSEDGLHIQGINKVSSDNCWAWVNSTADTAINAVGAAQGRAQGFCTAGKISGAEHFTPPPYDGCDPMEDPFRAELNAYNAPVGGCKAYNLQLGNGTHTLTPGTYCGSTTFKPQANVTLSPGLYIFRDGKLTVQAGAALKGSGVTLFFYGQNTSMEVRGGATLEVKAPTTGALAGFAIVDRKIDWYDNSVRETIIQGGGEIKIEGILYAPQWKLNISGSSEMNQNSQYFAIVADSVYMEGNGKLFIKSDAEEVGLPNRMPKIKNGPVILK